MTETRGPAQVRSGIGLGRLGVGLMLGTLAWSIPFATGTVVLLPERIESISPDHKVGLLAVLTAVAALVGLVASLVFGILSDRTRSRWGSRAPWIVAGGLGVAVLMLLPARAAGFVSLLVGWCLVVVALNAMTATLAAVIPDRVPVARRATLSAVVGMGILLGNAFGAILGAVFIERTGTGLAVAGAVSAVFAVGAVSIAPDAQSDTSDVPPRLTLMSFVRSIEIPRAAPDFYWALWGRLLLVLGYFMITSYQLYILTDYIDLSEKRAAQVLGLNAVIFLVSALFGTVVSGPLSDRTARRKPFVIGATVLAMVAIAMPLLVANEAGMMAFSCIGGVAFGCYFAVDAALMTEVLPNESARARDLSILNFATTGGQVLAPLTTSLLVVVTGSYPPAFIAAIIICAVGALLIVPIRGVR